MIANSRGRSFVKKRLTAPARFLADYSTNSAAPAAAKRGLAWRQRYKSFSTAWTDTSSIGRSGSPGCERRDRCGGRHFPGSRACSRPHPRAERRKEGARGIRPHSGGAGGAASRCGRDHLRHTHALRQHVLPDAQFSRSMRWALDARQSDQQDRQCVRQRRHPAWRPRNH